MKTMKTMKKNFLNFGAAAMSLLAVGCGTGTDESGLLNSPQYEVMEDNAMSANDSGDGLLPTTSGDQFEEYLKTHAA